MVIRTALLALVFLVAGCTRDWSGQDTRLVSLDGSLNSLSPIAIAPTARGRNSAKFASLPDHGELLAYPEPDRARRDGAYTWHRAELSEAHALRAILERKLRITTPSGQTLTFDYQRHVEHPSGDWTFIGHLQGGGPSDEIILTFGERAAFGSIAQPGQEPLRLTARDGISWLVETDGTAISAIDNAATRPRGPDYRIPPKLGRNGPSASASSGQSLSTSGTAAITASGTVVDVVLGYSSGFAAGLGGQSQALTRLNYLVEVTNQAYANSQIDAQVRLVYALQVDYPDTTANDLALEQLTGFHAPSTPISPAPAFSALRAARDQYGADLVALVRKFYDPEQDGCGIAWLIGGDRSGINAGDEFFGYSVVSDGTDIGSDGKNYYCRDETLAHEFGHNMGSQHDRATATDNGELNYGVFSYSFGHKTTAGSGNFFTIMAYGDTGQTRYRIFSNPRTLYCGNHACGIENVADNARSLSQTLPIVASFRTTVVVVLPPISKPRNDVNGDGRTDLLWRNSTQLAHWRLNGAAVQGSSVNPMDSTWAVLGTGDLTGDGRVDIVWSNGSSLRLWISTGSSFLDTALRAYPAGWQLAGIGDVDGNGKEDLLWRDNPQTRLAYWIMDGATLVRSWGTTVGSAWRLGAADDLTGDGKLDLVWASSTSLVLWTGNGVSFTSAAIGAHPYGWVLETTADVDADGKADLLWRDVAGTRFVYWIMNGKAVVRSWGTTVGSAWHIGSTGDMNADGKADVVWVSSNQLLLWAGNGTAFASATIGPPPPGWSLLK